MHYASDWQAGSSRKGDGQIQNGGNQDEWSKIDRTKNDKGKIWAQSRASSGQMSSWTTNYASGLAMSSGWSHLPPQVTVQWTPSWKRARGRPKETWAWTVEKKMWADRASWGELTMKAKDRKQRQFLIMASCAQGHKEDWVSVLMPLVRYPNYCSYTL